MFLTEAGFSISVSTWWDWKNYRWMCHWMSSYCIWTNPQVWCLTKESEPMMSLKSYMRSSPNSKSMKLWACCDAPTLAELLWYNEHSNWWGEDTVTKCWKSVQLCSEKLSNLAGLSFPLQRAPRQRMLCMCLPVAMHTRGQWCCTRIAEWCCALIWLEGPDSNSTAVGWNSIWRITPQS